MSYLLFFFFNDTATTEIYTLSLHDALPIFLGLPVGDGVVLRLVGLVHLEEAAARRVAEVRARSLRRPPPPPRSEEHTSELQSRQYLVCRLLLEKKKKITHTSHVLDAKIPFR